MLVTGPERTVEAMEGELELDTNDLIVYGDKLRGPRAPPTVRGLVGHQSRGSRAPSAGHGPAEPVGAAPVHETSNLIPRMTVPLK